MGLLVLGRAPARAVSQESGTREALWTIVEEDLEVVELLEACVTILGLSIEFEPSEIEGTVKLQLNQGLTSEGLWALVNRELLAQGFACVQMPGEETLSVVPLEKAAGLARLEEPDLRGARAGFVKVLLDAPERDERNLVEILRALLTEEGGSVSSLPESKAILLSDLKPQVLQAMAILDRIRSGELDPVIDEIPIEHLPPITLAGIIERVSNARKQVVTQPLKGRVIANPESQSVLVIAPQSEIEYWRDLVARFDRTESTHTVNYTPRRFGVSETARLIEGVVKADGVGVTPGSWRLVEDDLTGTVIITTTPSKHRKINELLTRMEETEWQRRTIRSYPVRNRSVKEVLELLQGFLEAGALEGGAGISPTGLADPGRQVQGPTAPIPAGLAVAPTRDSQHAQEAITLSADEGTNRIIAMGESRLLEQLESLIQTLDVRHTQVLVEALVVSLNDMQTLDLGVELQRIGAEDDVQIQLASLFGLGSPDPGGPLPMAGGRGFSGVVLDPGDFSGVLRALETLNEGRVLTVPKVLVNNNQEAILDSVLQAPYSSTNASDTVATTSFGGTLDAGTSITVTPQIAEGDQLILDYSISLSTFVGDSTDPALPPPRQENRLKSVVTIPDGFAIVVGGLEIETEAEATSQVPFFGSIPLLGNFFKSRSVTTDKTRFFVFLRASILRNNRFEDLKYFSAEDLDLAGLEENWPSLEPRIIR